MDRHALTAILAMAIGSASGCARARSVLPPNATRAQDLGPVELTPVEPIKASINQGKIPTDLGTVRASYSVEENTQPAEIAPETVQDETPPPAAASPAAPKQPDTPATAGADRIPLRTSPGLDPGPRAALTAARVGDTVITYRELEFAICQQLKCTIRDLQNIKRDEPQQANMMARQTLETLIDRTMILQEARREMKKPQQWTMFTDYVEKAWREKEVTALCRKAGVEDEFALKKKMEAKGESLDELKDAYKTETMARELLMMRVQPKVERPGYPDMQKYYAKHRNDPEYHREAQVKWHEVLIPIKTPKDLAAARKTAAAVRSRLQAGENFAKIAKSTSAGATAAKGGVWETAPDGYPVPAVNAALATLKIGEVSVPIESNKGIHLIRVESHRQSGPVSFVEIQKHIAETLFQERFSAQIDTYLKKLRTRTAISSPLFEGTSTAPSVVREKGKTDGDAERASVK